MAWNEGDGRTLKRWRGGFVVVLALALGAGALGLYLSADRSSAAFPGSNGKIVFDRYLKGTAPSERKGVFSISPSGEELHQLSGNSRTPAWSADGEQIAFARQGDIYKMNANGKKLRRLTKGKANDSEPAWSPNGKQIVFARSAPVPSGQPPGPPDIFEMKANGKKVRRLTRNPAGDAGPVWSPDGKKIAFWQWSGRGGVFTMNPNGSGMRWINDGNAPDWSPDGKKIAFGGGNEKIFEMTASGKQVRRLGPEGDLLGNSPAWSPDGKEIVFVGDSKPGVHLGIFKMDADGTNPVRLTVGGKTGDFGTNDSSPDWQPR